MAKSKPIIRMEIDVFGDVKIKTEGFVGTACTDATKAIQQALTVGATSTKDDPTDEMYGQPTGQAQSNNLRF